MQHLTGCDFPIPSIPSVLGTPSTSSNSRRQKSRSTTRGVFFFFRSDQKPDGHSSRKSNIVDIAIAAINVERSKRLGYVSREKSRDSACRNQLIQDNVTNCYPVENITKLLLQYIRNELCWHRTLCKLIIHYSGQGVNSYVFFC